MLFNFRVVCTQGSRYPGGNWVHVTEYMQAQSNAEVRERFNADMRNRIDGREIVHIYNEGEVCPTMKNSSDNSG